MTFVNATSFSAVGVPYIAPDGRDVVVAIVKATFLRARDGRLVRGATQAPVRLADDVYAPDVVESSVRYPSDAGTEKRGADVIVVGEAVSRTKVAVVDVLVQLGEKRAPLRVHGERVFYRHVGRLALGPAAPFERRPIVYESAYGGTSADLTVVERRNPVGRGVARSPADLIDRPAPSIEHPAHPVTTSGDAPEPAGYGAIASSWLPRSAFAGTMDEAWRATRMPLMPRDFDVRYFNVAHPALQLPGGVPAASTLAIVGMTLDGVFRVDLPALPLVVRGHLDDGRRLELRPVVDTVLVEPGDERVELTARAVLPRGRGKTLLREVQVDIDG